MILDPHWLDGDLSDFLTYVADQIAAAFDPNEREQMRTLYPDFQRLAEILRGKLSGEAQ